MAKGRPLLLNLLPGSLVMIPQVARLVFPPPLLLDLVIYLVHSDLGMAASTEHDLGSWQEEKRSMVAASEV